MSKIKYKVLDLFCGCGGISEGYRLAGFDIVGGIDFNVFRSVEQPKTIRNIQT